MPRPIHFEITADNPERAAAFYEKAFGWKINRWDGPQTYWLVTTGEQGEPGINGGIMHRHGPLPGWLNVIQVDSLDDALAAIEANGGKNVVPRIDVPGVGYVAYCTDTEGNTFGLIQPHMAVPPA